MTLSELKRRVDEATGPDRELDVDLTIFFGPMPEGARKIFVTPDYPAIQVGTSTLLELVFPLTASIDAAVALIEQVLPGWGYVIDTYATAVADVNLYAPDWPTGPESSATSTAQSARVPLALLSALLAAVEAQGDANDG